MNPEWAYEFPSWMAGREYAIKDWFEEAAHVHPEGCAGFLFRYPVGGTGLTLDVSFLYDAQTGVWT